jgi:hypothetical protein
MVMLCAPEFASWSVYFADGARERSAVEAGRSDVVDQLRADEVLACAEDFRDEVAVSLDPAAPFVRLPFRTAAS